jgi:hypothetical protein
VAGTDGRENIQTALGIRKSDMKLKEEDREERGKSLGNPLDLTSFHQKFHFTVSKSDAL